MHGAFPLRLAAVLGVLTAPVSAQSVRPSGPWKSERSARGDTTVVRTLSGSVWGDKVSLVEELRIGTRDGDGPDSFGAIHSMALFPDGTIAVFDGSVPALRLFGANGKHVRTLGRDGAGPGEYRNQTLGLAVDRDGNLLMYDPRNARINRWKQDGTVLPSWFAPGRLYTDHAIAVDTGGITYIRVMLEQPESGKEWRIGLARLNPKGEITDTMQPPVIPGDAPANGTFFSPSKYWYRTRAGDLVTGFGGVYALRISGSGLKPLQIERMVSRVPLQPAERKNYQEVADAGRNNPMVRGDEGPAPSVPAEKPYFRGIRSDVDGRIWVDVHGRGETYDPPPQPARPGGRPTGPPIRWREPRSYDVFRRDGTYLGYVQLPWKTTFYEARGDKVWAVQRGDDDENYIVRFRIAPR